MASHATGDGGIPPRDAGERGLRRVMSLAGAYGTRSSTIVLANDEPRPRLFNTDQRPCTHPHVERADLWSN